MDDIERYSAAAHGMQTGVAFDQSRGSNDGTPKHLRVGINAAMADHAGLVTLLIDKGVFTREEYTKAIADSMEREKQRYEDATINGAALCSEPRMPQFSGAKRLKASFGVRDIDGKRAAARA